MSSLQFKRRTSFYYRKYVPTYKYTPDKNTHRYATECVRTVLNKQIPTNQYEAMEKVYRDVKMLSSV